MKVVKAYNTASPADQHRDAGLPFIFFGKFDQVSDGADGAAAPGDGFRGGGRAGRCSQNNKDY
jgi:hypothetical protein